MNYSYLLDLKYTFKAKRGLFLKSILVYKSFILTRFVLIVCLKYELNFLV